MRSGVSLDRRAIATLVLLLAASGCVHAPSDGRCASLGSVDYCLQPPLANLSATQLVERARPDGVERLVVYLEMSDGDIRMAGVTPFGRRVWQIRYDASGALSDIPPGAALSAPRILAGLQLSSWPLALARAGVRGTARLVETPDGSVRRLLDGDTVVFSATCEGERPLCRRSELWYGTLGERLVVEVVEGSAP
jgi:hypothetical protein